MIGRKAPKNEPQTDTPRGFDAFELRLGDVMRGERATMGKSLLDVQRELRIKASYIAAIENCDPDAFDTPGFIAGYVRSYARYLNMNPDDAFAAFCAESGFEVAHGMSAEASVIKKPSREERLGGARSGDMFAAPATPFIPERESWFSGIEPGAIGSSAVLLMLISAIGFGGWTVLQQVQRVQVAPVDAAPVVLSEVDPLGTATAVPGAAPQAPRADALDRLYRPQTLDVPVLTARDAPIASIDPRELGNFAAPEPDTAPGGIGGARLAGVQPDSLPGVGARPATPAVPQVTEAPVQGVRIIASTDSWVRVRSAEGNVLYEAVMNAGDTYDLPPLEIAPTLRTGNAGAIYFAMGSDCYGPVGTSGEVYNGLPLDSVKLAETFDIVPPSDPNSTFHNMVADKRVSDPSWMSKLPCKID
ncbi:MAG: RodZ domain-containing protein [Pseudomonadota bacterium]